jgi:hypothetical protein
MPGIQGPGVIITLTAELYTEGGLTAGLPGPNREAPTHHQVGGASSRPGLVRRNSPDIDR